MRMFCVGLGTTVAIWCYVCWFGFLLIILRGRPFDFPLRRLCRTGFTSSQLLSLIGTLAIKRSGLAINAGVSEVFSQGLVNSKGIVTFDMLPCIACFAINSVPVIVSEVTNTLDRVRFFLDRRLIGDIVR